MSSQDEGGPEAVNDVLEVAVQVGLGYVPGVGPLLSTAAGKLFERRRRNITEAGRCAIQIVGDGRVFAERIASDERLAQLLVIAAEAAARTLIDEKVRTLGRAVGRAVLDNAKIDQSELIITALADLDVPHVRLLERMDRTYRRHEDAKEYDEAVRASRSVAASAPAPVQAALVRHGLVATTTEYDGATKISHVTMFGHRLLDELQAIEDDAEGPTNAPSGLV